MVNFANTNGLCDFYKNIITIVHCIHNVIANIRSSITYQYLSNPGVLNSYYFYISDILDYSSYITLQIKVVSETTSILK